MTTSTIKGVVDTIQTALASVTGIKSAPAYPTELASDFPFITTYPGHISAHMLSSQNFNTLWDIYVEWHTQRDDLPVDVSESLTVAEPLLNALYSVLKTNAIAHKEIDGDFQELGWGAVQTHGYRLIIHDVKVQTTIT